MSLRLFPILLLLLLGISGCSRESEGYQRHNPVIAGEPLADPAVILYENTYYLYATNTRNPDHYDVYTSTDLRTWQKGPTVFALDRPDVWAPDVFYDLESDTFYLYYSADFEIGVAVAKGPLGPFEDRGILISGAIDAQLFRDDDGALYLYYESIDPERALSQFQLPVGRIFAQPMTSPLTMSGEPILISRPDQSWERGWVAINEGPWVFKHNNTYYLTYSGNAAFSADYAIGYATATSPLGPFQKSEDNPLVARREDLYGPGHHAVVETSEGEFWLVYHQKRSRWWGLEQRYICVDRMQIDETGRLSVQATPMEASRLPR